MLGTDLSWPKPAVSQHQTGDPPPLSLQSTLCVIPSLLDGRNPLFWVMYRTTSFHGAVGAPHFDPSTPGNRRRKEIPQGIQCRDSNLLILAGAGPRGVRFENRAPATARVDSRRNARRVESHSRSDSGWWTPTDSDSFSMGSQFWKQPARRVAHRVFFSRVSRRRRQCPPSSSVPSNPVLERHGAVGRDRSSRTGEMTRVVARSCSASSTPRPGRGCGETEGRGVHSDWWRPAESVLKFGLRCE
jgi:hypothetical protein